jgi:hypothetical protein
VKHLLAGGKEIVDDNVPVATPPDGFRAHDRAPVLTTQRAQPRQADGKAKL